MLRFVGWINYMQKFQNMEEYILEKNVSFSGILDRIDLKHSSKIKNVI